MSINETRKPVPKIPPNFTKYVLLITLLGIIRHHGDIATIICTRKTKLRNRTTFLARTTGFIDHDFSGLRFDASGRCSIRLSRHQGAIGSEGRHRRHLLLDTHRLFSITSSLHSHVPLHGLDTSFRFLILKLTASKLFIKKSILLFLLLSTFSLCPFSIYCPADILTNIL